MDVVFEVSTAVTVTAHRNVSILIWRDSPTVASLLRIDDYTGRIFEEHGSVSAIVVVDAPSPRPPDQASRAEHARLTKKYEANSAGLAMIIDGHSAKHSMLRFVLTTLQLMSSPRVPQRICQSTNEAATWLASLDRKLVGSELSKAVKASRELLPTETLVPASPANPPLKRG